MRFSATLFALLPHSTYTLRLDVYGSLTSKRSRLCILEPSPDSVDSCGDMVSQPSLNVEDPSPETFSKWKSDLFFMGWIVSLHMQLIDLVAGFAECVDIAARVCVLASKKPCYIPVHCPFAAARRPGMLALVSADWPCEEA